MPEALYAPLPITHPHWQRVGDVIAEALSSYRCTTLQDEAEEPLPLLDALSQPDATSVLTAEHELEMLADSILLAMHSADATCSLRGGQIPDGWKLVPIEPTQKMVKAGDQKSWVLPSSDCWAAMLDAAPPPTSAHPQETHDA